MDLTNKVAIVTGGGQGIGEGICKVLAENGSTVIVTDLNSNSAKNVEKIINSLNGKAISYVLDVTKNKESLTSTFYEIVSRDTHCCVVSDSDLSDLYTNLKLELPNIAHYQEVIFSVALQYLAYVLSISRNINPDKPRNLAKVVTVE